jgi:drug/metabolite transporter (DMT)-like permease
MSAQSNAIATRTVTPQLGRVADGRVAGGVGLGLLGVLAFSGTLPATRFALAGGLDPWFIAMGRAAVAAALAGAYLLVTGAPRPTRRQMRGLVLVSAGVIVGFPVLSTLALTSAGAAHGAVVIALLPAATALAAVARAGERPSRGFWAAAGAGLLVVVAFAAWESGGGLTPADGLLLAATAICGLGYAEGGVLAREIGGPRTIAWALVITTPLTVPAAAALVLAATPDAAASAWAGFAYVSAISMFLGFFAWYAGLARGGVARIGQLSSRCRC